MLTKLILFIEEGRNKAQKDMDELSRYGINSYGVGVANGERDAYQNILDFIEEYENGKIAS